MGFLGSTEDGAKIKEYHTFVKVLNNRVMSLFSDRSERSRSKKLGG